MFFLPIPPPLPFGFCLALAFHSGILSRAAPGFQMLPQLLAGF
jgi:hypothetical protein